MTTRRRVKAGQPKLVTVIDSTVNLRAAMDMKPSPDLFELRLDCLWPMTKNLEKKISRLRAPIIVTARAPHEGGANNLSSEQRIDLLLRFLPYAYYVDVELSVIDKFDSVLARARKQSVHRILSYHNFKSTPSSRSLHAKVLLAKASGADVLKIATRTDTPAALARLIDFLTNNAVDLPVSVMGIGKLGTISRLLLARCGSVLNYGALGQPKVEGQLSMELLRSALGR